MKITHIITAVLLASITAGCTTAETIAAGITEKSITGSGSLTHSKVGIDPETKTPELETLIVSGDYSSIRKGETLIRIEEFEDASIFNSSARSRRRKILIANPSPEILQQLKFSTPESSGN